MENEHNHHHAQNSQNNLGVPIAIVIAGLLIAAALFFGNKGSAAAPANAGAGAQAAPAAAVKVDSKKVKTAGEPFVGNANAPLTLALWTDYQCPFCKQYEANDIDPAIADYVNSGKLRIVFKDFQFLGPDSQSTALIARAVWEADPTQFYDWRKTIYADQGQEGSGWATTDKIYAITTTVLGADMTSTVKGLVASKGTVYQKAIDADKAEASTYGINGTPGTIVGTHFINGALPYTTLKADIDLALAGK